MVGNYVDVHFTRPPFGPFTYVYDGEASPPPGSRLAVEFSGRAAVGLAGRPSPRPPARVTPKTVTRVIDAEPLLPLWAWEWLEFVARRYASSVGEVARLALPVPLDRRRDDVLVLTATFASSPSLESREAEEKALTGEIWEAGWLGAKAAGRAEIAARLVKRNVVAVEPYAVRPALADLRVYATGLEAGGGGRVAETLLAELSTGPRPFERYYRDPSRRAALRRLLRARRVALGLVSEPPPPPAPNSRPTLITGAGAEGRLEAALAGAREAGASSLLLLVPEVHRLPAARRRAESSWGTPFEIYSSEMSPAARWEIYRRCRRGTVTRVVGTRSSLFLPLPPETTVVVTEEADPAYKQWEGAPYYHAREVAAARAAGPFLLTAAAPSLETIARVQAGEVTLRRGDEKAQKPDIELVDMSRVMEKEGAVILSAALIRGLRETLAASKPGVVIVNRRGYVPYIYCGACGKSLVCEECDVAFTFHRAEQVLRCRYCMRREPLPPRCPRCGKESLTGVGFGTEKLAAEIELLFGDARLGRADSDALNTPARVRSFWEDFGDGRYDLVVGTHMAFRALEAGTVAFAALANADTAMNVPDFRACERTFRTITRLLEPTGAPRRVLVQTFYPAHYALAAAAAGDYEGFAAAELEFRRRLGLPPFTQLVNVVVTERRGRGGAKKARDVAKRLRGIFGEAVKIVGPAPAPVARRRGRRRWQILVAAAPGTIDGAAVRGSELAALVDRKGPVEIRVDVDPYDMF